MGLMDKIRDIFTEEVEETSEEEPIKKEVIQVEIPAPAPATTPDIISTEEYIPNLSIIDEIIARISEMPDENRAHKRGGIPIAKRRNNLVVIFEDIINSIDDAEMPDYIDFLLEHQGELFSSLTHIEYESQDDKIDNSFAHAGIILNYGHSLSPWQSELLNKMQEYM